MPDPVDPNDPNNPPAPTPLDLSNPEVKALVDAAVKEATSGLSKNKDEILAEKSALQEKLDAMGKQWEGFDPEAVKQIMERIGNDEETKLLAEGKIDEVLSKRTERLEADHATKLGNLQKQLDEATGKYESTQGTIKKLMVGGALQQAAAELGVIPTAIPDALSRAMNVFKVGENDALVAEKDGATIYGKDGKTPISPAEWLDSMKEAAPHWFPAPSGAGANGGPGGKGGSTHVLSRSDARDPKKYQAAKAAADKDGTSVQIVPD